MENIAHESKNFVIRAGWTAMGHNSLTHRDGGLGPQLEAFFLLRLAAPTEATRSAPKGPYLAELGWEDQALRCARAIHKLQLPRAHGRVGPVPDH